MHDFAMLAMGEAIHTHAKPGLPVAGRHPSPQQQLSLMHFVYGRLS